MPAITTDSFSFWQSPDDTFVASEDECLDIIDTLFSKTSSHVPFGRGDDCAELITSESMALSTDFFWQDIHFRTGYFTPEEAGYKALTQAVSDLAATGALPRGYSLGLMLPKKIGKNILFQFLKGMAMASTEYDIILTGGDLSHSDRVGCCVTVWGESVCPEKKIFLRRKQAKLGDFIFVIGACGMARCGFFLLEEFGRSACENWPTLCSAHLRPQAKIKEGIALAKFAMCEHRISLMDVSDGIVKDLPRLLGKYGADLILEEKLIDKELIRCVNNFENLHLNNKTTELNSAFDCQKNGKVWSVFLQGGEDYALLGTCSPEDWETVKKLAPTSLLGRVVEERGIWHEKKKVLLSGFDHFTKF